MRYVIHSVSLPVLCVALCLVHLALVFRNTLLFPPSSLRFVFTSAVGVTFPYTLALHGGLRANFKISSNIF